ncbi:MAG TPA: sugar phosphate isomerase/epimerase [Bryobacteraceae bacterium]|nr:sugar phosphate isomerase/epimerase [Bryobacteraceae bacterium]
MKLGLATYSLRKFSRSQAIAMIKELGVASLSVKELHLRYSDSPEALAAGRKEFDDAGLELVSGGVVVTYKEDDGRLRSYFDYAKICRFPMLIMMPTARQLPLIEKLVQEYGVRVAIHNHGPEDKNFPTPDSAYQAIRGLDHRIGLCVDVGHTARTGANVLESIERCAGRMVDMHIKDLRDTGGHTDCEVGRGVLPIPAILKLLHRLKFQGNIALEYEADPDNPLAGIRASLAYMRGVLDGIRG